MIFFLSFWLEKTFGCGLSFGLFDMVIEFGDDRFCRGGGLEALEKWKNQSRKDRKLKVAMEAEKRRGEAEDEEKIWISNWCRLFAIRAV